jgi:hypothetical protein
MSSDDQCSPVCSVPINVLLASDSPRLDGESAEHIRLLAESDANLPPILVHHATMRVIDGMHRLQVAALRGESEINATFFDGDETDAFILGVTTNVTHGLPLSLADRRSAAQRVIRLRPQWSNRRIASTTGLSPNTVGAIRRHHAVQNAQLDARIGQDGRVRPVNSRTGRTLAGELMRKRPDASLREVAEVTGISPETVRDVRQRLNRGDDPIPAQRRANDQWDDQARRANPPAGAVQVRARAGNQTSNLRSLKKDPSLRFSEAGRALLRLLDTNTIDAEQWAQIVDNLPAHCANTVLCLARDCAETWQTFVKELELRQRGTR